MDTWLVPCQSCGREYKVKAESEEEAIQKAKAKHEEDNSQPGTMCRCDFGPLMTFAFNLTHPLHPCAPKEF